MKEILAKKRRITNEETIHLNARCSVIIQRTLPQREKDPGRVILLITIGNVNVGKSLIDLGSSINLIPLSVIRRIGDLDIKNTRMTLQLAKKSVIRPSGIAEDVLVKVDKFLFPIDFVVMDIEEDDDEEVTFNLFDSMKRSKDKGACFQVDAIDEEILKIQQQTHLITLLERALMNVLNVVNPEEEKELNKCLTELDSAKEIPSKEAKIKELKEDSEEKNTKLELKLLPNHLKYVFLDDECKKSVIISKLLANH
ncbi:uncharacterized protein LOC127131792 [Lathyrus oleraceus]|uniref:uncharacterized protein LOC127131792 n=1 Tax=Pisum sativum TaxID=3888 RepID=UPI0021D1D415|nr:uncharacterized protein LOC127131792 [Pisum sativum]